MRVLYESAYASLTFDPQTRIVRWKRTGVPFPTLEDVAANFGAVSAATAGLDRSQLMLLSDVRDAPGRNDPAFESTVARFRNDLFAGFARRAALVRTVAGKLQIQRLNREQHSPDIHVFQDEAEAIAYLAGR